jgi:putative redox protein
MHNLPFSKHSIVTTPEGGMRFVIALRDHQVRTDQPEKLGGTDTAPTPLELLGASLSGCVALYVHKYCAAEGLAADDIIVEAKPVWRENPGRVGRFDVLVHLPDTIPEQYHEAINEAARSCPVHHTLTHTPEISVELRTYEGAGV